MAKNTGLKRDAVKYIRDGIKSQYKKKDCCEICGTTEDIELHHYHTVAFVLERYTKEKGLDLSNVDKILAMREEFYKDKWYELVEDTVSLCNTHHVLLHKIYGQKPLLHTASKQKKWVEKMHNKANGIEDLVEEATVSYETALGSFAVKSTPLSKFLV